VFKTRGVVVTWLSNPYAFSTWFIVIFIVIIVINYVARSERYGDKKQHCFTVSHLFLTNVSGYHEHRDVISVGEGAQHPTIRRLPDG
jgi:hypothetical protein